MAASPVTYVLIHGAGDSGGAWDLVADALRGRGHDVVAPDLPSDDPGADLGATVDAVVAAVGDRDELVVVGHSLGAFVAPLVADRLGAGLLVLVAGMVPKPGESIDEWWAATGYTELRHADGLDEEALFLHDVPAERHASTMALGREQSDGAMRDPWPLDAWPDVPTRFLLCREDRFFPADFQRRVVRDRLGIEPDEMDGGHLPARSRPLDLAARLEAYREAVSPGATDADEAASGSGGAFTVLPLDDVEDAAPGFGLEGQEIRFATGALEAADTGVTHHRYRPGARPDFAHRHRAAEEVYVVLRGSGRVKIDDEVVPLAERDAVRIAPAAWRAFEAGADGLEVLAFGPRHPGDGEVTDGWWPR